MREIYEFLLIFLLFVLFIAVPISSLLMVGYFVDKSKCSTLAEEIGAPYRYSVIAGCRIKTDDGWIPLKNYRQQEHL